MGPASEQKKCCGAGCCNAAPAEAQELNTNFKPTEGAAASSTHSEAPKPLSAEPSASAGPGAAMQLLDGFSLAIVGRVGSTKERLISIGSLVSVYPLMHIPEVGGMVAAAGLVYGAAKVIQPFLQGELSRVKVGKALGNLALACTGLGAALLTRDLLNKELIWTKPKAEKDA